jgi:Uma2 family endonuclease
MPTKITTAEQLLRDQHLGRCELIRGELRLMDYNGAHHGQVTATLLSRIGDHVEAHRLGTALAATGFVLSRNPDTVRAPDGAFLRADRVDFGPGYVEGAPDLAVEVLSPDDRSGYVREKVAEWLEAGAGAVWVVDPDDRTVTVHEPRRKPKHLAEGDTLQGGSVLPGFEMPVAAIFA